MLYMVVVNRKYLVPVNASSAKDAERTLRRNVAYGIDEAIGFDPVKDSIQYMWAYNSCESISMNDMMIASNRYQASLIRRYNEMLQVESNLQITISKLEEEKTKAMEELRIARYNSETFRVNNGLNRGVTPMREIMELEKLF